MATIAVATNMQSKKGNQLLQVSVLKFITDACKQNQSLESLKGL